GLCEVGWGLTGSRGLAVIFNPLRKELGMDADAPRDLLGHFDDLQDPRVERTRLHRLDDILAIAILAVICGADGWVDMEQFGRAKHDWLKTFLHLPNGIPSHDTFGRVFTTLDPD